jgi:hypothetical protein
LPRRRVPTGRNVGIKGGKLGLHADVSGAAFKRSNICLTEHNGNRSSIEFIYLSAY